MLGDIVEKEILEAVTIPYLINLKKSIKENKHHNIDTKHHYYSLIKDRMQIIRKYM